MQISTDTPTRVRKIANIDVQVARPYSTGHVVTDAEANILNQTLAENVSNNLRAKFEVAGFDASTAQDVVNQYLADYNPGVSRGGGARLDPIEKEMKLLATAHVDKLLASKGMKSKEVDYKGTIAKALEKYDATFRKQAEGIVKARQKAGVVDDEGDADILASLVSGDESDTGE